MKFRNWFTGALLGALHAGICSLPRVNDIAVGIALMLLGAGLAFYLGKPLIQPQAPQIPSIELGAWSNSPQVQAALSINALFPLGEPVEATPWMGSRPCFADSRPVIGRAPGQSGLWLAYGHAHWGLTLGPVTGRLISEMMTGATPFCDPAPYGAERFTG